MFLNRVQISMCLAVCLGLNACQPLATPTAVFTPTSAPTVAPSTSTATVAPAAGPDGAAQAYLTAWQKGDFAAMYARLAPESRAALSAEAFQQQYHSIQLTMTVASLTATVTSLNAAGADSAQAQVHVRYATRLVEEIETEVTLPLKRTPDGKWGVVYSPALIWPTLTDGRTLFMLPETPQRGTIYDRNGKPLVADQTEIYAIGLVPGEIVDHEAVQTGLARLMGVTSADILARYENAVSDQYLPVTEAPAAEVDKRFSYLWNLAGVKIYPYTARFYYGAGDAAHVTGYVSYIGADEMEAYRALGYAPDQLVGKSGLEKWGETALAGHNGGTLVLMAPDGKSWETLYSVPATPSQDIYTTIDSDFQSKVRFALGNLPGAAVVLRVDTGEVLALVSNPAYDPNVFNPANANAGALQQILNDQRVPLNDRAVLGFPAGSVFKVVTMAAGMNSGLFTPDTQYTCNGEWEEIPGTVLTDWKEGGHGTVTLKEGLAGSCNPYFWHIGYALFNFQPQYLSNYARLFGLGQLTGIQIEETAGQIPDPDSKLKTKGEAWEPLDSLNLAIGQGDTLVTPLQIARVMSAIGNDGTLYQPQLVLKVQSPDGAPTYAFAPAAAGQLPLTPEQLTALQEAMHDVTQEPLGTARNRFKSLRIPVAGKTGTAEDPGIYGSQEPDAWFAGYTMANRTDKPDIAIAVVVTNLGQGSDYAAPIFRRIVEMYFGLSPVRYPWESAVGVIATPEPTPTP